MFCDQSTIRKKKTARNKKKKEKKRKESLNNVGKKVESLSQLTSCCVYVDDLMLESIHMNRHMHTDNNNVKTLFCLINDEYKQLETPMESYFF